MKFELTNFETFVLVTSLIIASSMLTFIAYRSNLVTHYEIIPKNYAGVWLDMDEPRAYVLYDLTDLNQLKLVQDTSKYFREKTQKEVQP